MSGANIPDTSYPGSQVGPPFSPAWIYDFDPATGSARATFNGEVRFSTGGSSTAGVTSWNGRTGSVALETADLTALDALFNPSPALQGVPTAPTAAASTSTTQVATCQFVMQAVAAGAGVVSFNGRQGAITLTTADITAAGGAPTVSPALTGNPTAPTPPATDASSSVATTQYVQNVVAGQAVVSFNGRRGVVNLTLGDVTSVGGAPLNSPAFTGTPTSTNPPTGDASTRVATTEFVTNAVVAASSGVVSFNTRQGVVTLQAADISGAGGALLAGPVFTGQPEAPTPPANDASTRLATTEFVETAITSMAPIVTSFNTRTGAVALQLADVTSVGGAPLASPTFTGSPNTTAPAPGDNSSRIPTTSWVDAAIAALPANVASFNGRTGAVTLTTADVTAAGAITTARALTNANTGGTTFPQVGPGAPEMAGLGTMGFTITPNLTGAVQFTITGMAGNSAASAQCQLHLRYGGGTPPATSAAVIGTQLNLPIQPSSAIAGQPVPFSLTGLVTGLTLGTTYWFDVDYATLSAGSNVAISTLSGVAIEV